MSSSVVISIGLLAVIFVSLCQTENWNTTETEPQRIPLFIESLKKLQKGPSIVNAKTRSTIETAWIEQKLDHFDETETGTWKMRYMSNDEHFEEGGPIFIMVGGEWDIYSSSISGGHFYDMAKEHKAMLYHTEHRFYGESRPKADMSMENLKYLHTKQALADLEHFIRHIRETVPALANSKIIMAGGSYSASMVIWFKQLYPELLTGGWASSAPIFAKVNFEEYKEVAGRAILELGSQKCYNRIKNGIAELERMFEEKRASEVKAMMKLCNTFDEYNDLDVWALFTTISILFTAVVQGQEEGHIPFLCNYLDQFEDDETAVASYFIMFSKSGCIDITYKTILDILSDPTYAWGLSRPWFYQTCNEFGWYQTTSSGNQPFGTKVPLTFFTTLCYDVFSKKYTNEFINLQVSQTNDDFGGMDPKINQIFITHGELDPWSPMGINEGATIIPRTSHWKDFGSIDINDSPEMRAAKEKIAELVRQWLA